jgi:hypothetical protein
MRQGLLGCPVQRKMGPGLTASSYTAAVTLADGENGVNGVGGGDERRR